MVTDNELLDGVRAVLHAEVADVAASPVLLASVRRRHARRRAIRRAAWTVAPFTAAAAVAAVVLVPAATPAPSREVTPVNVAHVLQRTSNALGGVDKSVVYERAESTAGDKYFDPGERGVSERWNAADGSAFRYRATVDGSPRVDLSYDTRTSIDVDYRARTYRKASGMERGDPYYDDVWTPAEIRKAIKDRRITVVGRDKPIHGNPTVRLKVAPAKATPGADMWVDAKTYLPVRWRWLQEGSAAFDVTFLPPTPENLAKLTAPIPPGFTEAG